MTDTIERAADFATRAHTGQVRKYTGDPYIVHPRAVAERVAGAGGDPAMIAAAWLHDTVEDTGTTLDDIRREFGDDIAELLDALTDKTTLADGNRATRKAMERERLSGVSDRAKTIKLADLIDNAESIIAHDPGFARVFVAEARALLAVLRGGDAGLWNELSKVVNL